MFLTGRQAEILDLAKAEGRVLVEDLATRFSVTPQTIRKDLNDLCDSKALTRIHGGALFPSGNENVKYEARRSIAAPEKQAIGRAAAAMIPDNSSLFINIGTTTEAVGEALLEHRASMSPPTASTAPAQRSDSSGLLPASASSARSTIVSAPNAFR